MMKLGFAIDAAVEAPANELTHGAVTVCGKCNAIVENEHGTWRVMLAELVAELDPAFRLAVADLQRTMKQCRDAVAKSN